MRVELYITPPGSTIAQLVDMLSAEPLSLNYSILDITEPDKRSTSFSKTIKLPGSKANNKLFNYIYEISGAGTYNPNKKAACTLLYDTLEVFSGFCKLQNISTTLTNEIEYEVVLLGEMANLFFSLQQVNAATNNPLYLQDLHLDGSLLPNGTDHGNSANNCAHGKNPTAISSSWTNTTKYTYPLMDDGCLEISTGYYRANAKNMRPAVFTKTLLDEIFWEAGTNIGLPAGTFKYKSDFLTGSLFPKLINPVQSVMRRQVNITLTGTVDVVGTGGIRIIRYNYVSNTITTVGYIGLAASVGTIIDDNDFASFTMNQGDYVYLQVESTGGTGEYVTVYGGATWSLTYNTTDKLGIDYSSTVALTATTTYPYTQVATWGTIINNPNGAYSAITGYSTCLTLNLAGMFSNSVTQVDFFMSIVKLFNLYVQPDKYDPTLFYIEPRDNFYSATSYFTPNTIDWTGKLDVSQPTLIDPMAYLKGKVYDFTYKADSDFWNNLYTSGGQETKLGLTGRTSDGWQNIYGELKYNISNDFLQAVYQIQPASFSPTPIVVYDINNDIALSSFISAAPFTTAAENGQLNAFAGNLRILYYGGLKTPGYGWWLTTDRNYAPTGGGYKSQYPYAGHLDDPYNPTLDLNYFMPFENYAGILPNNYTNNGLFNKYWATFVAQTTDATSKLITAYFRLTAYDMSILDFRNQIFVNGEYYYLHSIEDYNPLTEGVTKVSLLKVINQANLKVPGISIIRNVQPGLVIYGKLLDASLTGWPTGGSGIIIVNGDIYPGDVVVSRSGTLLIGRNVIGGNIRDKVPNGRVFGGKADTLYYPFKIVTEPVEISRAQIIGNLQIRN